jgi:hypothetical protein
MVFHKDLRDLMKFIQSKPLTASQKRELETPQMKKFALKTIGQVLQETSTSVKS